MTRSTPAIHRAFSTLFQTLALLTLLLAPALALAQATPFVGEIVEDTVDVRAGAGTVYYTVGQLKKGDRVKVVDVFYGWYKIEPPKGINSYISKGFVDAKGDGKTGVVSAGEAAVKAADPKGPAVSYRTQVDLKRGETVQILGEDASFYKIAPPKGAYVYVAPSALRRAENNTMPDATTETPATPATTETTTTTTPATPATSETPSTPVTPTVTTTPQTPVTTTSTVIATTPETPVVPSTPGTTVAPEVVVTPAVPVVPSTPTTPEITLVEPATPATSVATTPATPETALTNIVAPETAISAAQAFDRAEKLFAEAMEQRLEEQPLDRLARLYANLLQDARLSPQQQYTVKVRLAQLDRNAKLAAAIGEAAKLRQRMDDDARQLAEKEAAAKAQQTSTPAELISTKNYDLVGQLMASAVYDGSSLPRLYRLIEPASFRTLAYVRPGQQVDPNRFLGNTVGIIGQATFDPALKLNIIEVKSIDLLGPAEADK